MSKYHTARKLLTAVPFGPDELSYGPAVLEEGEEYADLPPCPRVLVIVDVQEEFNVAIKFDTRAFLAWLRKCSEAGTEFHIVYDELGDEPGMFAELGPTYYAKCYGADPYKGVVDKETGEEVDASEIEGDVIYHDPAAKLDIFMSSGHEWQHVYPDMVELADALRGRGDVALVGGAADECLRDMTDWLDISDIDYRLERKFVYG